MARTDTAGTLRVATALGAAMTAGDSLAVNGVCLTVTAADAGGVEAQISPETARVTTLGRLRDGSLVNLERPLRADARLGGHFVLGHVDAVGRIVDLRPDADCHWLDVELDPALAPLVVPKGSIAIDGISLTVARVAGDRIGVQIVPFTFTHTSLAEARPGDAVNLEADVLGKYVARLLGASREPAASGVGRS